MPRNSSDIAPLRPAGLLAARPHEAVTQQRAGFFLRAAATLLDLALFVLLYFTVTYSLTRLPGRTVDVDPVRLSATLGNVLWLMYSSLEWLTGRTPGKLILRMKITADDGSPAARWQLLLRWAAKQSPRLFGLLDAIMITWLVQTLIAHNGLSVFYHDPTDFKLARIIGELLAYVVVLGFLLTLRPDRKSLHDHLTGTAVYRRPRQAPARPLPRRDAEPVIDAQEQDHSPVMVQPLESRDMI
jgi:uncharacterized RDD family membrane protein YckC